MVEQTSRAWTYLKQVDHWELRASPASQVSVVRCWPGEVAPKRGEFRASHAHGNFDVASVILDRCIDSTSLYS